MNTMTGELYATLDAARQAGVAQNKTMQIDGATLTPYQRASMKIGRNDPCPCGSGKRFKKCHLGQSAGWVPTVQTDTQRPLADATVTTPKPHDS